ncbi:MAG: hypothetical protein IJ708_10320, partial [Clostridia bacterium]|nr:hypothetical protein [Clostridia bacterium]
MPSPAGWKSRHKEGWDYSASPSDGALIFVVDFGLSMWYNNLDGLYKIRAFQEDCMLLNNIELDVKTKCIEEKISQQQVGEDVGT